MSDLDDVIAGLPKAELHVHHVGSASLGTVAALAARHPGVVPEDPDALAEYYTFTDFAHFVDVYLSVVDLLRTPDDLHLLTSEVAAGLHEQRVRYAEVTLTPYTSVVRGIPIEAYTEAVEDARLVAERDLGIVLRWVYDIPGESGLPAADATLGYALEHRPDGLVGFGLGGPEIGVPRPQFAPHFARAKAAGLRSVPHSGESTGPESVWDAVRLLGAERVGHGIAAAQDPALMAHLAAEGIALEVCPTSNLATRVVSDLSEHPLPTLVAHGVPVTVASDDPPMFGTTLSREYAVVAELLGLDRDGVGDLARASVHHSFAPDDVRRRVLAEIDDYLARLRPAR